jgi:hypothetical protein
MPVLCAALAMAGGSLLATVQASPVSAASNPDTLIYYTLPGAEQASQTGQNYLTDQNLFIGDNGGEVTWGAFSPCQFTGATVDLSNGAVETFGANTAGTTAPGGVRVTQIQTTGVDCTNTVGAVAIAPTSDGNGFFVGDNNGDIYSYGDADSDLAGTGGSIRIAGLAEEQAVNGADGVLQVTPTGALYVQGGANFYGDLTEPLNAPIVGLAVTPDDQGYWMVASDGGVFAFGDAKYYGSMGGIRLNQPIVGMAPDDATGGYWLVASDGGVFSFNAPFYGSTGAIKLNQPIVGMEAAPDGSGYRFVASDGGVFCFNLPFVGSLGANPPSSPIAGMAPSGNDGYWLVEHNNTVQSFGSAPALTETG